MAKNLFTFYMLLIGLLQLAAAQTSSNTQTFDDGGQHRSAYVQLNRQIIARHSDNDSEKFHISEPGKAAEVKSQLHGLISHEIMNALSVHNPSQSDVTRSITALQGEMAISDPESTNTPFAELFQLSNTHTAAVAYIILQGGDSIPDTQPYLEFYDQASGS